MTIPDEHWMPEHERRRRKARFQRNAIQTLEVSDQLALLCRAGAIVECNSAAVSFLGATEEADLQGRQLTELVDVAYRDMVDDLLSFRVLELSHVPTVLRRVDGTPVEVALLVHPARELGGNYAVVVARDMSIEKRLFSRAQSIDREFKLIVDCSMHFICRCRGREIVYMNQAARDMLRVPDDVDVVRGLWADLFQDEYREIFGENVDVFLEESGIHPVRLRCFDGTSLDAQISLTRLPSADGQAEFMLEARDITAHNRAVGALRRMNETLEQEVQARTAQLFRANTFLDGLIAAIPNPVWWRDMDGVLLGYNAAFATFHGIDAQSWIGWRADDAMPEQFVKGGNEADAVTGAHVEYEAVVKASQGRPRHVLVNKTAWMDSASQPAGVVGIMTDITERKAMEEALAEASRRAEAANRAKSEFLANMSHEIRTPMNAILGLAHLLKNTQMSGEQCDFVNKIAMSGRSLLGILNDILDFSKIEANRLDVEAITFPLDDVLTALATIMSVNAGTKELELVIDAAADVPRHLVGDPARLQQILVNLAGNAIKFTEAGEVGVHIGVEARRDGRAVLRFSVRDTGIGLTAEQQARLFQPFVQADATTTRKFGGTGLGLAICRRLVQLMGGEIGINSAVGEGSEFWFTVPFGVPDEAAAPAARRRTLVVADDSVSARQAAINAAALLGWQARGAASGTKALEILRARAATGEGAELLVLDWRMPGPDGLATLRALRADPALAGLPVVMMVTAAEREDILRAPDAAAIDAVLVKPVTCSVLDNAVEDAVARRAGGQGRTVAPTASVRPLAGLRILLVEDNLINQQVAKRALEHEGGMIEVAGDGQQAVERLRSGPKDFDIVLMDAQMPVMDGFEATSKIRWDLGVRDLPIIALTAGIMQSERDKCLACGMNDFIGKPFEVPDLVRLILRHAAPRAAAVATAEPVAAAREAEAGPLPGIDVESALNRMGGDEDLLYMLLPRLVELARDAESLLRADLEHGATDQAAARAHTLCGAAGNLSAVRLAELAGQLETTLRSGHGDEVPPLVDALGTEAARVCAGINAALAGRT